MLSWAGSAGVRLNLADVEAALAGHPGVAAAAVTTWPRPAHAGLPSQLLRKYICWFSPSCHTCKAACNRCRLRAVLPTVLLLRGNRYSAFTAIPCLSPGLQPFWTQALCNSSVEACLRLCCHLHNKAAKHGTWHLQAVWTVVGCLCAQQYGG